jgi:transposase InsO family protein
LGNYPEGHPFREAWKWLTHQFTDDASKVTLPYFKRYVQAAIEEIGNTDGGAARTSQVNDDTHALLTIERLTQKLEQALAMTNTTGNKRNWPGNPEYSGCRFCGSKKHHIKDCDDPGFDYDRWNRNKGSGKPSGNRSTYDGKKKSDSKSRRGGSENAQMADSGSGGGNKDDTDVSTVNTMKMNNAIDCYEKIGKHPSPEIDSGDVSKGGSASPAPPVRYPLRENEFEDMDVTDKHGHAMFSISESISERLFNVMVSDITGNRSDAILDSGCTRTMWRNREMFGPDSNYRTCDVSVKVGDGHIIKAIGMGDVILRTEQGVRVKIPNCLLVPDLKLNLVSVSHLDSEGFTTTFQNGLAHITHAGSVLLVGRKVDNLYHLELADRRHQQVNVALTSDTLHKRLGHFALRKIRRMGDVVLGLDAKILHGLPEKINCEACVQAKSKRTSFPPSQSRTGAILELLHMDLAGPSDIQSIGGNRYILVIVDDYSRYYHIELLRSKSDAFDSARKWIALQERRTGSTVKAIRSDNGGEFVSREWTDYYSERGIRHERTVPYTPEQNGKAERAVGILKDGIRSYLLESGLSKCYWAAAAANFTDTRNMIPTADSPLTTPYELFNGRKPDVSRLRTSGCVAYVHIPKQRRGGAWAPRARRTVFLGYAELEGSKAWVFYDPNAKERIVSLHATFWEDTMWQSGKPTVQSHGRPDDDVIEIPRQESDDIPIIPLRRSNRVSKPPQRLHQDAHTVTFNPIQEVANLLTLDGHQPVLDEILYRAYLAAGERDHTESRFLTAKKKELASMSENEVWELVPLPSGARAIACRWLCTDKLLSDLTTTEKARLIVLGHLQRAG